MHLLIHSSNGRNGRNWADLSQEYGAFFWVFYMGAGNQELGPFSADFPVHKQGDEREMKQVGHEPVHIWDAGTTGEGLP